VIKEIVGQAATSSGCGFYFVSSKNGYDFYKKIDGDDRRFLVLHETTNLKSADSYNFEIEEMTPEELKRDPAFQKNTDLVVLLGIDSLGELFLHEKSIFSVEENPYYYKKYVLYFSPEEREFIGDLNFSDLSEIILNREKFKGYKSEPSKPSIYSIVARLFIKLPFLKVPVDEKELKDVNKILSSELSDNNLLDFDSHIESIVMSNNGDMDLALTEYVNEKMED